MSYCRFPPFQPNPPTANNKTAHDCLAEILSRSESQREKCIAGQKNHTPSSKGKPTDPKPKEEVTAATAAAAAEEEVQKESKGTHTYTHTPSAW
jgi:hypothetical protein